MSRDLPPQPSLEYLRKRAKALLSEMQQHNPALQLADAQHALAREYGFASWPKLKAHLNALSDVRAATNPFAGSWAANLAKSQRHPLNPFRSATLHIDVVGDVVTIVDVVVDAEAREERHVNVIRADGTEHPSAHGNGYLLMARWHGPHVLETLGTKNGEVIGRGVYEVAADGTTLTISSDEQVIVLDRDPLSGTAAGSS